MIDQFLKARQSQLQVSQQPREIIGKLPFLITISFYVSLGKRRVRKIAVYNGNQGKTPKTIAGNKNNGNFPNSFEADDFSNQTHRLTDRRGAVPISNESFQKQRTHRLKDRCKSSIPAR